MCSSPYSPRYIVEDKQTPQQTCALAGCSQPGLHVVPEMNAEGEPIYYCQSHAADFNAKWKRPVLGCELHERATWGKHTALNGHQVFSKEAMDSVLSDLEALLDYRGHFRQNPKQAVPRLTLPPEVRSAYRFLELSENATIEDLKKRYKTLAKELHPDQCGGSKKQEERMKKVNQSYQVLTQFLASARGQTRRTDTP